MDQRKYRVGQFAKASGVSIRTLHHYDRLGLVKAAGRDDAGYRYYTQRELLTLQQVLTLRYLGFSLGMIAELMRAPSYDVEASLRAQRRVLQERRDEIASVTSSLDRMLRDFETTGEWDWQLVAEASQALAGKEKTMDQATMMKRFAELGAQLAPGERESIEQEWTALFADIEADLTLESVDPRAIALADRWTALRQKTEASYTSRGFGDLWQAIGEARRNGTLPSSPNGPSEAISEFISKVYAAQGHSRSTDG
jgi:MerR family transcriptional regulator, thiopeptide resistance regulator